MWIPATKVSPILPSFPTPKATSISISIPHVKKLRKARSSWSATMKLYAPLFFLSLAERVISVGVCQTNLPEEAVFPGVWDRYIQAPANKSFIRPRAIKTIEGDVGGFVEALLVMRRDDGMEVEVVIGDDRWDEKSENGGQKPIMGPRRRELTMGRGGLVVFDFEENIAGRVCFDIADVSKDVFLALTYSESPEFADANGDATTDSLWTDLPLYFPLKNGTNCLRAEFNRGAFRFLSVRLPADPNEDDGFWHTGSPDNRRLGKKDQREHRITRWLERVWTTVKHFVVNFKAPKHEGDIRVKEYPKTKSLVAISQLWINSTSFPSNPNPRAYSGYFYSSSHLLNRIWYAGAYTLQLSTINPKEGSALIDYNRRIDHNQSPHGTWYSNFTISKGRSVTIDGAKRDRMVWPGDMSIAVPGIAVSTHDMEAVRNALEVIFDHQYSDGSLPYAGPPMGYSREFSDTYHLHTLLGTYNYVLYSGDVEWLAKHWKAYKVALAISIGKVDDLGLLHVTSTADWLRPGMSGHNLEASALLLSVLKNSFALDGWLYPPSAAPSDTLSGYTTEAEKEIWSQTSYRLTHGIERLYCAESGMYADNLEPGWCGEPREVLPQDGNSWVLLAHNPPLGDQSQANERLWGVSDLLKKRWLKHGAPAPEFPNVISPFTSSFELLGHCAVGEVDTAVELMLNMWGYMLHGTGMTNSTLAEGYRTDGYAQYPAYWSPARGSHAHGWSTGPTTALTDGVLGIKFGEPAGKFWVVRPELTSWLSFARGGTSTKLGKWEVKMKRLRSRDGRVSESLQVKWPRGTSGRIEWGGEIFQLDHTLKEDAKDGVWKGIRWADGGDIYVNVGPHSSTEHIGIESKREELAESHGNGWGKGWEYMIENIGREVVYPDSKWTEPEMVERPVGEVDWEKMDEMWRREIPVEAGMPPWHIKGVSGVIVKDGRTSGPEEL